MEVKQISTRLLELLTDNQRSGTRNLIGRLLTIVDAITEDPVKRKGIKDLVEEVVYSSSSLRQENIRYYMKHLARALKEKCIWAETVKENTEFNPLTD